MNYTDSDWAEALEGEWEVVKVGNGDLGVEITYQSCSSPVRYRTVISGPTPPLGQRGKLAFVWEK